MTISTTIRWMVLCGVGLTTGASIEPAAVSSDHSHQQDPCLYFDDWREEDWLYHDYVHQNAGSPEPPANDPWPFEKPEWTLVHPSVPASDPKHNDGPSGGWTLIYFPFHPVHHLACHPLLGTI